MTMQWYTGHIRSGLGEKTIFFLLENEGGMAELLYKMRALELVKIAVFDNKGGWIAQSVWINLNQLQIVMECGVEEVFAMAESMDVTEKGEKDAVG